MNVAKVQWEALEMARKERHVANGEVGFIELCRRDATTGALVAFTQINRAWEYTESRVDGGVAYELRVSEIELPTLNVLDTVALKHGAITFMIKRPSPIPPIGDTRYWIFNIAPAETS